MTDGLFFGWRTALLLAAVFPLLPIIGGLLGTMRNRVANRTLAALLVVMVGIVMPYIIGFAGFYDQWRWIQYLPISNELAAMPLLYLYMYALTEGKWPDKGWRHSVPALLKVAITALLPAIYAVSETAGHFIAAALEITVELVLLFGGVAYAVAAYRLLVRYRQALADVRSDDTLFASRWLGRALVAMGLTLAIAVPYKLAVLVYDVDYFGQMALYTVFAGFALYLGIEGWRHAALPFPLLSSLTPEPPTEGRDWKKLGEEWAEAARQGEWALQPDLSLADLARKLGTNTSYLSRGLNEGLGMNFSSFINGLRSEIVATKLRDGSGQSLLDMALEAGFSSKPTFNRAFQSRFGKSPTAYRSSHVSIPE
ncbi:helix-turn-helix transcriptional regulator [Altererythrobacter sp. ZODW24]|uniref:helix-turn-helix domain-containing protein n=1 Tax=Altererythrobacter sp. ZODW24 TaxID=2185142 RepID=UPI00196241E1|nr:helix-turn-helix transcriptional regulator [Altererythrobacter sp. ZODW24]